MQRNRSQTSVILAATILIIVSAFALGLAVHAQVPDFSLTSTPSSLCVNPGVNAVSVISVESVGGFAGTVNLSGSVDPAIAGGPSSPAVPSTETLVPGQTATFNLETSTTISTPTGIYYVTVSGLSGASFHQTTLQLIVSSSCSVGGSVLPLDRLSLLSPYVGTIILSGGMVALIAALVMYRRRTDTSAP